MNDNILVAKDNKAFLTIVIPTKVTEIEKFAAEELSEYLEKVSGAVFEVVSEDSFDGKGIYIGYTDYADRNGIKTAGNEEWYIKADNGSIIISGGTCAKDRGTLYGVYHFIEDYLGVRWWNEWEEYIPKQSTVAIPEDFFMTGEPEIKLRQISTTYTVHDLRFLVRNRNHGDIPKRNIMGWGLDTARKVGGFIYSGGPHRSHTMPLYIPAEEYFEEHPDWFAWDEKYQERNSGGQLCFSNEEVAKEMGRKVLEAVKQDNETADKLGINRPTSYGITLGDFGYHCQCEKCRESVEKSGMIGHILKFINTIAAEVAKESPGTMLDTPAYSAYREPPKDGTMPAKNVYIRLCDVNTDILHGLNHRHNTYQKRLLVEWAELCRKNGSHLNIQDYYMYQFPFYPLPILFKMEENFKLYHEYGINGTFIESHEEMENSMWTMQNWLTAKLMENPTADFGGLLDDFVYKYYGAAGEYVKEYLYLLRDACEKYEPRVTLHYSTTNTNYIDLDIVIKGNKLFTKALDNVKDSPELTERVKMLRSDLDKVTAVRYNDFKRLAKDQGIDLGITRQEAADRALEVFDILERKFVYTKECEGAKIRLNLGRKTIMLHREDDDNVAIPTELAQINPDDVYQLAVSKLSCYDEEDGFCYQKGKMAYIAEDKEAMAGVALRLDLDKMPELEKRKYKISGKGDKIDNPMPLSAKRSTEIRDPHPYNTEYYYLEDLKPDEYSLYKLSGIRNVSSASDCMFTIFGPKEFTIDLSAVSMVLPAEKYDVYVRMKFVGEAYGGSAEHPNAIYLDRIYVVRDK